MSVLSMLSINLSSYALIVLFIIPLRPVAAVFAECQAVAQCKNIEQFLPQLQKADTLLNQQQAGQQQPQSGNQEQQPVLQALSLLLDTADTFCLDPGQTLDCRPGCARTFYRLAEIYYHSVGAKQRAHNLYQLAMSMFWDMTRVPQGMECLEAESQMMQQAGVANQAIGPDQLPMGWHLDFNSFMDSYLSVAKEVHRHTPEGLPDKKKFKGAPGSNGGYAPNWNQYKKRKIAITSVCAYKEDHMFHELYGLIKQNRDRYVAIHENYDSHLWNVTYDSERAPVWAAVGLPLSLVMNEKYPDYDWILAADCDMQFVNMDIPLERILDEYVNEEEDPEAKNIHLLITEDGRGLAGGIFFIRNSHEGRALVSSVYGDKNTVYDRHDLKDQWSFLWHLIRPKATATLKPLELEVGSRFAPGPGSVTSANKNTWAMLEYRDGVRLVPQKYLNSYPWISCRPSHHCFDDPNDLIVSFITLSSFSKEMAYALLNKFLHQSIASYEGLKNKYPELASRLNHLEFK